MTGGISIGVTYFGTDSGSRVPPGICAMACLSPSFVEAYSVSVVAPVYLMKPRRVILSLLVLDLPLRMVTVLPEAADG